MLCMQIPLPSIWSCWYLYSPFDQNKNNFNNIFHLRLYLHVARFSCQNFLFILLYFMSHLVCCCLFVFLALQPIMVVVLQPGSGLYSPRFFFRGFLITHKDAPQSVGLLWTSDQSVAETSTWQHTALTTDKHPCPRWNSNPQSQQASGRRSTP